MRVLIVSNMYPTRERPEFGVFVRDQLEALGRIEGIEPELYVFEGGGIKAYRKAVKPLKAHLKERSYDVVHAHYGLTGWVARKAGAKPLLVTLHGTDVYDKRAGRVSRSVAKKADQVAVVSEELGGALGKLKTKRPIAVMPTGVNLSRFDQRPREQARKTLGIDPEGSYVLFPFNPDRPVKHYDRALEVAGQIEDLEVLTLGNVPPDEVVNYMNAVDATLVPSEYEGFGLAALETLACNTPVVATRTGMAPALLDDVAGCHCIDWDPGAWTAAVESILEDPDPRVDGRPVAERWSTDAMARRLVDLYQRIAAGDA
ncbi:MAG: glycosyltransferase [Solirubrobacterales bacterium]